MAEEVYYTGLEEFGEVSEAFREGTIGSSTLGSYSVMDKFSALLAARLYQNFYKGYESMSDFFLDPRNAVDKLMKG